MANRVADRLIAPFAPFQITHVFMLARPHHDDGVDARKAGALAPLLYRVLLARHQPLDAEAAVLVRPNRVIPAARLADDAQRLTPDVQPQVGHGPTVAIDDAPRARAARLELDGERPRRLVPQVLQVEAELSPLVVKD